MEVSAKFTTMIEVDLINIIHTYMGHLVRPSPWGLKVKSSVTGTRIVSKRSAGTRVVLEAKNQAFSVSYQYVQGLIGRIFHQGRMTRQGARRS